MPGFKVPRKTARLQFEGEEFEGCEIILALDLTFGAQAHLAKLQAASEKAKETDATEADSTEATQQLMEFFSENCIQSWNLEDDDGKPLPLTSATFAAFPSWFGLLILNGWTAAVNEASEVSAPLDESSRNGRSSQEESELMEASSSVLPSSATPSS